MTLEAQLEIIKKVPQEEKDKAQNRWNAIAKPLGSLGKLEDLVIKVGAIKGNLQNWKEEKRALIVFAGDHGVVEEGVALHGSAITKIMTDNFPKGMTCVSTMAKVSNVHVYTVDIGMYGERYSNKELSLHEVIDKKVGAGAGNIAIESAMTSNQCRQAIQVGIDLVKELKEKGYGIIGTGEMGIGNTTPTSALTAVLLNKSVEEVAGTGAGLSPAGFQKKKEVLDRILLRHKKNDLHHVLDILSDIGGYEIAGMVGTFLGGAIYSIPVIIDGVISSVAALAAVLLNPYVKDYILPSHLSAEPSAKYIQEALGFSPIIHGDMRLGEGSGAVALIPLLDMGIEVYEKMIAFEDLSF